MTAPAPAPATASLDPASLGRTARQRLDRLLAQLERQSRQTDAAADQLTQRTEQQMERLLTGIKHQYGVFLVGHPPRPMVLRDVEKLNGQGPITPPTDDFAAALKLANDQLTDPVRVSDEAPDISRVVALLTRLIDASHQIDARNALLTGDGTPGSPYRAAPGLRIRLAGPITIAFPAPPDQLRIARAGHEFFIYRQPAGS